MRRLPRLLFTTLAALSLLLAVLLVSFWTTSLRQGWEVTRDQLHPDAQGYCEDYATVSGGGIQLRHEDWTVPPIPAASRPAATARQQGATTPPPEHHLRRTDSADYPTAPAPGRGSFTRDTLTEPPYTVHRTALVMPCWFVVLLTALLPTLWLLTRSRPHPARTGRRPADDPPVAAPGTPGDGSP